MSRYKRIKRYGKCDFCGENHTWYWKKAPLTKKECIEIISSRM